MTPQQLNATKLALEALEGFYEYGYDRQECFEHITAIKEALLEHAMQEVQRLGQEIESDEIASILACRDMLDAQPVPPRTEQEPVAYIDMMEWPPVRFKEGTLRCDIAHLDGQKLFTTQPQRKPLTHEQRLDLLYKFEAHKHEWHAHSILIDMVEAAHGIKGDA